MKSAFNIDSSLYIALMNIGQIIWKQIRQQQQQKKNCERNFKSQYASLSVNTVAGILQFDLF